MEKAENQARARFAALVARPEIPLAEAALAAAEEEYPGLDARRYLAKLDWLGGRVGRCLAPGSPGRPRRAARRRGAQEPAFVDIRAVSL